MADRYFSRRDYLRAGAVLGTGAVAGCLGPRRESGDGADSTGEKTTAADESTAQSPDFEVETVATGFRHPWGLAMLSDFGLLVTERPGRLQLLDRSTGERSAISGLPEVYASGQGGLLDVTHSPGDEQLLYLTYAAKNESGKSSTHLARARLDRERKRLTDLDVLHAAEPFVESNAHYGSRVVFGPDGMVYMTVGDRHFKNFGPDHVAQDPTNELGSTLRLTPDGSIPSDNPFVGDSTGHDAVYSYGHRNPQGLTVHPETGAIWESEHGEKDGDEINVIESGANYGWPVADHGCHYGTNDLIGDRPEDRPDLELPVYYWPCGSGGFPPSGMTFYEGEAFPQWQGDLFVGSLGAQQLGHFSVSERTVSDPVPLLADRGWRIRDVTAAPETGSLYVAIDNATAPIVRLVPV